MKLHPNRILKVHQIILINQNKRKRKNKKFVQLKHVKNLGSLNKLKDTTQIQNLKEVINHN